jgi:hypothetical protein
MGFDILSSVSDEILRGFVQHSGGRHASTNECRWLSENVVRWRRFWRELPLTSDELSVSGSALAPIQNFARAVIPKVRGAPRNALIWLNWNGASNATW